MKHPIMTFVYLCVFTLNANAGNLSNGQWHPANCGQKSPAPQFNTHSVEDYNKSVKEVMVWQTKTQEYTNCLIKEANADNDVIAKSANAAQDEFGNEVKKTQAEANTAKAKVEKN